MRPPIAPRPTKPRVVVISCLRPRRVFRGLPGDASQAARQIAITLISILQLAWVARRETSTVVVVGRWTPR